MGSYDQPKAYFGMTDRAASRNSTLSSKGAASNFKNYMARKSATINAVRNAKDANIKVKQNDFWADFQNANTELLAMESALTGSMGLDPSSEEGKKSGVEITNFKNQIQMQLVKIAGDLSQNISGAKGRDMSEADIQTLIGQSVGRVAKLQNVIVNVLSAAEEYYDAPEGTILSSSNPELQLLFDGLRDDKIDMIFGEDDNGDWSVYPVATSDSRSANHMTEAKMLESGDGLVDGKQTGVKDGVLSPEERVQAAQLWAQNTDNKLYREIKVPKKDGNGDPIPGEFENKIEYNYIKNIGALNLTQLERDFKNGTGDMRGNKDGAFFDTVGDYKTLTNTYNTAFQTFLKNNNQALQKIEPSGEKGVAVKKRKAKGGTVTGSNSNLPNQDQEYYNPNAVQGLLESTEGDAFLQMFLSSETINSDLSGWLGEPIDLLNEEKYGSRQLKEDALKAQLIKYSLNVLPGGKPIENTDDLITEPGGYTPRKIE